MITAEQIRAARALLRLEQEELARKVGVSVTTIRRLEAPSGMEFVARDTAENVIQALQEAGVEFIHQGVSLKAKTQGQDVLLDRLRAIAEKAAAQSAGDGWLTDADLYGDDGLPH
jgi:transcriptional regulator with XRE-family HTH domain